jgi:phage N-6-adenine-methyltransferase
MASSIHFKSDKQDWQTPDHILDLVKSYRPIRLDPCTVFDNPTGAQEFFIPVDDGITQSWDTDKPGLIYVNPPYGRELKFWVEKCASEAVKRPFVGCHELGSEILLLVPARTDTAHWHHGILGNADALCYIKGRLKFRGAENSAPFPSALVYFGDRPDAFQTHFGHLGHVEVLGKLPALS